MFERLGFEPDAAEWESRHGKQEWKQSSQRFDRALRCEFAGGTQPVHDCDGAEGLGWQLGSPLSQRD